MFSQSAELDRIYRYVRGGFREACSGRGSERRIGAELKFPFVCPDGSAVDYQTLLDLWDHLVENGWERVRDESTGEVVGARRPGEKNHTVASYETGYCKAEFSLAHAPDLHRLQRTLSEVRAELRAFADEHQVAFLGYGIHPMARPGAHLASRKSRSSVWDEVFPSNRHVPPEEGDDFHLFTLNADSHVHVTVSEREAAPAINVLNGFAAAQIALTADSSVWKGRVDEDYKCVTEKLWDWWMPDGERVGMPRERTRDLRHYVRTVASLEPVFVKREGRPVLLPDYDSFIEYYTNRPAEGVETNGNEVKLDPKPADFDVHSTCYWCNARLSHHYTIENRVNDQQPPGELLSIAALTLGLVSALEEAEREVFSHRWEDLREARERACRHGSDGRAGETTLSELAARMFQIARHGLEQRDLGEEQFLRPLQGRLEEGTCPADQAAETFREDGPEALVKERNICRETE